MTVTGGPTLVPVFSQPAQICPAIGAGQSVLIVNLDTTSNLFIGRSAGIAVGNALLIAPGASSIEDASRSIWGFTDADVPPIVIQVSPGTSQYNLGPSQIIDTIDVAALAAAIAAGIFATGIPIVANPIPLYDIASTSGGPAIGFGTNNSTYAAQVAAGVTGLSSAIDYNGPTGSGMVNGIPASWPGPGITFPGGITQIVNVQPDIATTLAGLNDARWNAYVAGAPNGSIIMPYHEANLPKLGLNPSQVQALDNRLIGLTHAVNPTLIYARGLATSPQVESGNDPTPFITPGMDFYGMDGYQADKSNRTAETQFGPMLAAIQAVQANAKIGIIETGTALTLSTWMNDVAAFAIANNLVLVQTFFGSGTGSQPFNVLMVPALNVVSAELAATSSSPTIPAGNTATLTPIAAQTSPVAGYANAQGLSYDILISLNAGVGSTIPWLKFVMHWFDDDASNAREVSQQQWCLPMGTNGTNGTKIQGTGPQRGRYLKITAINTDTVACTIQVEVNSTSRSVTQDEWVFDIGASSTVPTYTKAPDGGTNVKQLAGVEARAVPASGSLSYLTGMKDGSAYVRFGTAAATPVITVTLTPQPDSVFNQVTLLNELLEGTGASGPGDFTDTILLPRAPCKLTFTNSDTSPHNVFASIISAQ
jgi:hypothetical protein